MDENTLILSGLPNDFALAKPRLELHFSNRRKSGADILEIKEHPRDRRQALLVYSGHEAAKKVLEKSPHKVNFKTLGVVELQVKPFKEDGAAIVESCKPKLLPPLCSSAKAPSGQSEPEIEEAGPGPFLKEGLPQDCSSKTPLLLVSADRAIDEEILRLYFERFTEDDVEICSHGQRQWMLKLTSQSDLENVLSKQNHDLEGLLMSVELYDEKAVKERLDPYRFILSGFRLDCKCSHLSIFIQSCSRGAEHSWEILNDGERIAVTFKQDIDVEAFLKKCCTKKLQNMDITACRLEYTDSVLVEGHMDQISKEALRQYFSSTRSHGGQIKHIRWVTDAKSAHVEFENYCVAHRVAEQEHDISGVSLRTSLYYSSLQQALTGEMPSMPPSPHKCSIPVDALLFKYIQSDKLCKEDFEDTFKELHATISFKDDLEFPQVVLEMAVDRESLLFFRLAHTWERKCKEAFGAMLDKYIIVTLPTPEEVWERVMDKCHSRHLKAVTVYYERAKNSVVLIGKQDDVKTLQGEIQLLLSKANEELNVEKNTVEKVIPADSNGELDFVWKILSPKLGGVELSKDGVNLTLCVKGLRDDVNAAMGIVKDTKDNLSFQTLNLPPSLAEFLRSLDLKKFERNHFSHLSATVFSFGDSIQILAEKQDAEKASDKIKEVLTEDVINLTPDQAKVTTEKDWKDFYCRQIHEIQSSNNVQNIKISLSNERIAVCGFRNVVMDVARKLRGYLNNKMPVTRVILMKSLREVEYVDSCMKLSEVSQIKALDATILSSRTEASPCLKVTAASDKVNEAVAAVERLISNIGDERHIYSGAGESKVLDKHQDALKAKVKELGCKVYFTVERSCQTSSHLSCSFKMGDFFTLTIVQGNLSQQAADAVICPLGRNLSFNSDADRQILQAGGPKIKYVRDKLLKGSEVLVAGDVVVADPGNLPVEALFYAIIPNLDETNNKSKDSACFESAVRKSLENANDMHFVSLLMPALVCEAFSLSTRESCMVVIQEISEFWRRHQGISTYLRHIFVVDSDASILEEWHSVLKEMGFQSTDSGDTAVRFPPAKEKRPPPKLPKPRGNQKVIIGNVTVILKQGDITKEVVDAIVNSTNCSLKLDTGVSGAILEAAGKSVVDECAKLGTQGQDGVVVTGGGNLKCKHIIHMVGPTTASGIIISIEKVLQLCESKNIESLSIPAVGTGQGKINAEESIMAILTGLQNHSSLTTSTGIKSVFIVALEQKIFASFCQYFSKWNQQSSPTKRTVSGLQLPSIQSKSTLLPANQEVKISGVRIEVKKGDITTEGVRAIVNSTNKELNLKGGVSGAIFRAAGSSIEMECKNFGPQKDDGVVVTSGGQLQCDFIIHMVGPLSPNAATSQVENVLEQCEKNKISTVSFPAIGTGGGRLNAADVICAMLQGFRNHLSAHSSTVLKMINIVVYEDKIFQESLQGLRQWSRLQLDQSVEDKGNDGEDAEDLGSPYEWDSSDEKEEDDDDDGSIEVIMGPIQVKALCGDITQERADVIVNSTNTNLDLSKGVSGAILKVAGQAVLNECKTLGPQSSDAVVLTKPGNLKCKHIAHMVGQTKAQAITSSMYKVLETSDRIKAQSVSFPALGTGAGNLAASQVAGAMIDAISNFLLDKPKSSVAVVRIVIFQPKMMADFEEVMKKFKRVQPKFGGAAAKAGGRTTLPRSPNSSCSQGASTFNLEAATARITFPVTVAEVYGTSAANLAQAKKLLDDTVSEECTSQGVEVKHLHLLTEKEKQGIVEASQMYQVRVIILQNKLTISGKREDVLLVIMQIKDSLLKAREREDRKKEERRIWQTVRWQVGGSDTWIGLNQRINCDLELAFHRNEKFCHYQHKMKKFRVDFDNMQRTDSDGQITRIKRTPLSDAETAIIAPPPTWTKMDGKDLDIIVLTEGSKEFQKISGEFVRSCQVFAQENNKNIQVVQIQRLQHQEQWRRYAVSKQALDRKYSGNNNEQLLYHGTTKDICQKINKNGFNRSFCGRNATKYGCGTYFAKEAYYSCYDSYSNPDENGHKRMYRARVLTGKPCAGQVNMKEPSPLDPTNLQAGLHDCAVDNLRNPFIFVIFSDSGAYPEYLITFKAV